MAEGFLRHIAGESFDALSGGTDPVGVDPNAVYAASVNSGSRSKSGMSSGGGSARRVRYVSTKACQTF
jgi:hypothetical protein